MNPASTLALTLALPQPVAAAPQQAPAQTGSFAALLPAGSEDLKTDASAAEQRRIAVDEAGLAAQREEELQAEITARLQNEILIQTRSLAEEATGFPAGFTAMPELTPAELPGAEQPLPDAALFAVPLPLTPAPGDDLALPEEGLPALTADALPVAAAEIPEKAPAALLQTGPLTAKGGEELPVPDFPGAAQPAARAPVSPPEIFTLSSAADQPGAAQGEEEETSDFLQPRSDQPLAAAGEAEALVSEKAVREARAAARADQPATPSPLLRNVLERLQEIEQSEGRTRLLLRPQGLGILEIEVARMADGRLQMSIRAENPMILQSLQQDAGALADFLGERGFDMAGGGPDLSQYSAPRDEKSADGDKAETSAEAGSETEAGSATPTANPGRDGRIDITT